jgi:hypothetical protein
MKKLSTINAAAMVLGLTCALGLAPARAEVEVLESSVPEITVGTKLDDKAAVKVPEGATLRVLVLSSGTTKTIKGPYQGTIEGYQGKKSSWWERLTGGDHDKDVPVGATRGLRAE